MIIEQFHIVCVAIMPAETQPVLIVNPNRMLSHPIPRQCFKAIPRWDAKRLQRRCRIKDDKLSAHLAFKVPPSCDGTVPIQVLRVLIGEGLDHE